MKRDGIKTYFNDDNSLGMENVLLLPNGVIVPFEDSMACQVMIDTDELGKSAAIESSIESKITNKRTATTAARDPKRTRRR